LYPPVFKMKRLKPLVLLLLTLSVCFFTLTGPKNIFQLAQLNREIARIESTNQQLESEIEQLSSKIEVATQSSFFLEKKAREELALSKPGEIVYAFPQDNGPQR